MNSNLIGQVAWGLLGLLGLFSIVDLGFGPIVICPRCGFALNSVLGFGVMARSAAPWGDKPPVHCFCHESQRCSAEVGNFPRISALLYADVRGIPHFAALISRSAHPQRC